MPRFYRTKCTTRCINVDLDHLTVSGGGTSWQTSIAYSSCRRLTFKHYNKPFVSFEKCVLDGPRFENCHLERFEFIDSSMSRPVFRNARLSRCELRRSIMGQANFDKCDLIDLKVSVPKQASAEILTDFYKRLRVAFQSQGERDEAARFYYEERFQQLRAHAFRFIPRVEGLPGLAYGDTLWKTPRGSYPGLTFTSVTKLRINSPALMSSTVVEAT